MSRKLFLGFVALLAILLAACAPTDVESRLHIGQSESEVVSMYGKPADFTIKQAQVAISTGLNGTKFTMTPENVVIPEDRTADIWILSALAKEIPSRVKDFRIEQYVYEKQDNTIKYVWFTSPESFALVNPGCSFRKHIVTATLTGGYSAYILDIDAQDCEWKNLRDVVYLEMHRAISPQNPWGSDKDRSFDKVWVNASEIDGFYTRKSILPPNQPTIILP